METGTGKAYRKGITLLEIKEDGRVLKQSV